MTRLVTCVVVAAALAATALGCGGSSPEAGSRFVRYHDPSQGWTAVVPAGWTSVGARTGVRARRAAGRPDAIAPADVPQPPARRGAAGARGRRGHHRDGAGRASARASGCAGSATGDARRASRSSRSSSPWPKEGADAHVAALVARRAELERLVRTALLPALDSFVSGPPDPPAQRARARAARPVVLADDRLAHRVAGVAGDGRRAARRDARRDPRARSCRSTASPSSATATSCWTRAFGPFAEGRLGEPYASGRLHELQSATKSVSSMLLGIALSERGREPAST